MAIRSFLFCDICNPQAVRSVELRRSPKRPGGRRLSDGRSWFEGSLEEAVSAGWKIDSDGNHICKRCASTIKAVTNIRYPYDSVKKTSHAGRPRH